MACLSYTIKYAEAITDAYDSVVVVGENFEQEHYAAFTKPYLQAIKALSVVNTFDSKADINRMFLMVLTRE